MKQVLNLLNQVLTIFGRLGNGLSIAGRLGIGLLFVLVLGFSYLMWSFNRPPVNLEKLATLQSGMSKQQVKSILGEPNPVFETGVEDTDNEWHYSLWFGWSIVYIYFDERGLFKESRYDY